MITFFNISRRFSVSSLLHAKEIKSTKKDNKITVEGVILENKNEEYIFPNFGTLKRQLNQRIEYTDVLILKQFLDKHGNVIPIDATKLSLKDQLAMELLIERSKRAGLLPEKISDDGKHIYYDGGVHKFNVYYNKDLIGIPTRRKMFPKVKLRS